MKSVINIDWINGISQFNFGIEIATLYILAVWYIGKGEGYCYYLLKQKIIPRLLVQIEENDNQYSILCNTFKLRELPKALTTKSYRKLYDGRGNDLV